MEEYLRILSYGMLFVKEKRMLATEEVLEMYLEILVYVFCDNMPRSNRYITSYEKQEMHN